MPHTSSRIATYPIDPIPIKMPASGVILKFRVGGTMDYLFMDRMIHHSGT